MPHAYLPPGMQDLIGITPAGFLARRGTHDQALRAEPAAVRRLARGTPTRSRRL
jgi:hypothetical protein